MKTHVTLIIGICAALISVLVFLHVYVTHLGQPLIEHSDLAYHYFLVDNNLVALTTFHWGELFNSRMFWPLSQTAAFGNTYLGQALLGLPFYLLSHNSILTTNLVIVLNFGLAFLGAYLLTWRYTKYRVAAVVAGLIYAYNPFILAHTQLELVTHEWIPFIFLVGERILDRPQAGRNYFLLAGLSWLTLVSSFYYFFFVAVTLPLYLGARIYAQKTPIKKYLHWQSILSLVLLLVGMFWYMRPFMAIKQKYGVERDLETITQLSAHPSDFLFTSPQNWLYGGVATGILSGWRDPFARIHYTERSLFPGLVAVGLGAVVVYLLIKKRTRRSVGGAYFLVLVVSLVLAFGPSLSWGPFHLPLPYAVIYRFIPMVDALRAISRFVVIAFLALSVLAGLATAYWWQKLGQRYRSWQWLLWLVPVLIMLEYIHIFPVPQPLAPEVIQVYSWLKTQSATAKVILELPMANTFYKYPQLYREPMLDSQYLLYATLHTQKLVNGYHAFVPPEFLAEGDSLALHFPTPGKLQTLRDQHVDLIIVHQEEYTTPAQATEVAESLRHQGLPEVYQTAHIHVFSLR